MSTDEDISTAEIRRALDKFLVSRGISSFSQLRSNNLEERVDFILYGRWGCIPSNKIDGRKYTPRNREDHRKPTNMR